MIESDKHDLCTNLSSATEHCSTCHATRNAHDLNRLRQWNRIKFPNAFKGTVPKLACKTFATCQHHTLIQEHGGMLHPACNVHNDDVIQLSVPSDWFPRNRRPTVEISSVGDVEDSVQGRFYSSDTVWQCAFFPRERRRERFLAAQSTDRWAQSTWKIGWQGRILEGQDILAPCMAVGKEDFAVAVTGEENRSGGRHRG